MTSSDSEEELMVWVMGAWWRASCNLSCRDDLMTVEGSQAEFIKIRPFTGRL